MLKDYLSYAIKNIKNRKLRSWLTILGIIIGIAAVVALISLGQGLQEAVNRQFSALGTDKITITASSGGLGVPGAGAVVPLTEKDRGAIEKVFGVEITVNRIIKPVFIEFNKKSKFEYVVSVPEKANERKLLEDSMGVKIRYGKIIEGNDKNKVVLGSRFADSSLFGKAVSVGDKIVIQEKKFEVTGIIEPVGSFQIDRAVLMLENELKELMNIEDEINVIIAKIYETEDINEVAERIEKALRKSRNVKFGNENFEVSTPQQILDKANVVLLVVQFIVIGIAAISLIVGGVGITNTMFTSVLERTNEIGVMKAIGAKNSDILSIFLIESGLIGLLGGILGILFGVGLGIAVQEIGGYVLGTKLLQVHFSFVLILGALLFSLIVGIISGVAPAMQASKMKPVDSLRYE